MTDYEEDRPVGPGGSWAILIFFCLCIIAWGLVNYFLIKDRPREWDYSSRQETPGASIYSTSQPAPTLAPSRQFAPLPARATQPSAEGGDR